ncbi:hypothetical protein BV898_06974 [Hypsibius exemplaris]|uniref:Uncharacterized protein n=1 Tax=Hypsibius exemplaris TaxID=2072580 RepID=A0A1W0WUT9_HYPEX|nr:hypothetical protein BV898_06974 [Hypsibius exemplaris]
MVYDIPNRILRVLVARKDLDSNELLSAYLDTSEYRPRSRGVLQVVRTGNARECLNQQPMDQDTTENVELAAISSDESVVEILTAGPKVNMCRFTIDDFVLEYGTDQRFFIGTIQGALDDPIVFYVSTTDPSNLFVEKYSTETVLAKIGYYGPIHDVLAILTHFVVMVNSKIFVYRLDGLSLLHEINNVELHSSAAFALAVNNHFAYCEQNSAGYVTSYHPDKMDTGEYAAGNCI